LRGEVRGSGEKGNWKGGEMEWRRGDSESTRVEY